MIIKIISNLCRALCCLAALFVIFAQTATAQETALDYTFGTNGRVVTDIGGSFDGIRSVAVQTDGKIVAGGQGTVGSAIRFTVARYNANGSLDGTFAANGILIINILNPATGNPLGTSTVKKVLIQPDGKILLVGDGDNRFVIVRLNADASFDSTFGANGRVVTPITSAVTAGAVTDAFLQPDGKIVLGGSANRVSGNRLIFRLGRYNTDGTVDTTFGTDGFVSTEFSSNTSSDSELRTLALLPDGKILAAGRASVEPSFAGRAALARYNSNGTLDASFGTGGLATDNPGGIINEIAVQADGKIIAANGGFANSGSGFGLTRYNANGAVDQTFGEFGRISTVFPAGGSPVTTEVLIQPDGKILAAGYLVPVGWVLARFEANGTLDRTFGTGGRVQVTNVAVGSAEPLSYDITLQPDGKILFGGGFTSSDFQLVRLKARNTAVPFDFDGDARADLSVFRPSNGVWYLNRTTNGFYATQFGVSSDALAPADYDGDGRADIAVWRGNPGNPEFSYFYILQSSTNTLRSEQFGSNGDNPSSVGDWDADGKADLAVYRPSNNFFYYRPSAAPATNFVGIPWGTAGDVTTRGDFDGDGKIDAAVFRPSNGFWYVRQSSNNQSFAVQFGAPTDKPVSGDFDGDGRTDLAVFRPSNGAWYIRQSSNSQFRAVNYGTGTDKLVAADYDGDGKTDVAVWRDGTYYVLQSANSQSSAATFGAATDTPAASAFVQ